MARCHRGLLHVDHTHPAMDGGVTTARSSRFSVHGTEGGVFFSRVVADIPYVCMCVGKIRPRCPRREYFFDILFFVHSLTVLGSCLADSFLPSDCCFFRASDRRDYFSPRFASQHILYCQLMPFPTSMLPIFSKVLPHRVRMYGQYESFQYVQRQV